MEGNSSCLSSFAYSIRYLWKTGTRELPTLACGQETASKSSSIGHWFHFKETGSGPHLLLHPPQSPPLPPCVRCALLFLHSAVAAGKHSTLRPPPPTFPTAAAAPRPVAIEPTCVSINS